MEAYYFDEEKRAQRGSWKNFVLLALVISGIVGIATGLLIFNYYTYRNFSALQRFYFGQFSKSYLTTDLFKHGQYKILMYQAINPETKKKDWYACRENDLVAKTDESGDVLFDKNHNPLFLIKNEVKYIKDSYMFYPEKIEHKWAYEFLSKQIFRSDLPELFYVPAGGTFFSFIFAFAGLCTLNKKRLDKALKGKYIRGTRLLSPQEYAREMKDAEGIGIDIYPEGSQKSMTLRVPLSNENQGGLVLGDTGTGKTVTLQQIIYQARAAGKREPGFCYDPVGDFLKVHFHEECDFVLNPLDDRFPNWQLKWEIESAADADLVAESFFNTQHVSEQQKFFNGSAKGIFKLLLLKKLSNQKMIEILSSEKAIDALVKDTELAHKISAKAGPQRGAVLGTLADVAEALRLLPVYDRNRKDISLTDWARNKGQSWLFLTSTLDTRAALRPLQAAMLNILMLRLMSVPSETGKVTPFWFVADELHSLNTLSAFPTFIYESRKFGAKCMIGTQNKHQYVKNYDKEALALLASPALKIFLRCNETETAQWIAESIGNEERKMPFTSVSVDGGSSGKSSTNYSNRIEKTLVVSKEQIMHLENLHGYWCYEGKAVPFKLETVNWKQRHLPFIKRQDRFAPEPTQKPETPESGGSSSSGNSSGSDIDLSF
jgi:Type IV secretion-system coupling protein DNA-binding domain